MKSTQRYFMAALAAGALFVSFLYAEIPAGYVGKPYPPGSPPHEIPGRINFHDYDYVSPSVKGGPSGVTFLQDDQAYGATSGGGTAGGRDGKVPGIPVDSDNAWPAFFLSWHLFNGVQRDTFYAKGAFYPDGVRYPSPDTSAAANDWYIGSSHPNGWTKFTIHVPTAGKYWISSIWTAMAVAGEGDSLRFTINFMNGAKTVSTPLVKLPAGESYNAWREYSDFASLQLDSGVQVMQFQNGSYHIQQDFLYISADSGSLISAVPVVQSITPSSAINNAPVRITMTGLNFGLYPRVALIRPGYTPSPNWIYYPAWYDTGIITATDKLIASSTVIACTFNINGAPPGAWNVVFVNADYLYDKWGIDTLRGGFTILSPVPVLQSPANNAAIPKTFGFNIYDLTGSLRYELPKAEHVFLRVYGMNGQLQSEPVNMQQGAGYYTVNMQKGVSAAGPYLVVFKAGDFHQQKMVFLMR